MAKAGARHQGDSLRHLISVKGLPEESSYGCLIWPPPHAVVISHHGSHLISSAQAWPGLGLNK